MLLKPDVPESPSFTQRMSHDEYVALFRAFAFGLAFAFAQHTEVAPQRILLRRAALREHEARDELVRLADPDGSGWVTVEEFVNMPCWQLPPMPLRERENPAKGAAEASSGTYRHVSR
mgnify:CR=1 FL=1